MKHKLVLVLGVGIMLVLVVLASRCIDFGGEEKEEKKTYSAVICITSNSEFTSENSVNSGSGTESDPYIIEDLDIDASTAEGINIRNTTVYFIIRNCVIHNGKSNEHGGIFLYNVTNGKIDNVTSYNNFDGIYLVSSSNNTITKCTVYDNSFVGIMLYVSSDNNTVSNCSIYDNSEMGIWLLYSSNNNIISKCALYNNYVGILSEYSSNTEIHHCNIYDNGNYGIRNRYSNHEYLINATYNWWGSANGPSDVGPGTGDAVTSNVLYDPWLTEPVEGVDWTPPEGGFIPGFNLIILIVGIGVAIILFRRRKKRLINEK